MRLIDALATQLKKKEDQRFYKQLRRRNGMKVGDVYLKMAKSDDKLPILTEERALQLIGANAGEYHRLFHTDGAIAALNWLRLVELEGREEKNGG